MVTGVNFVALTNPVAVRARARGKVPEPVVATISITPEAGYPNLTTEPEKLAV